jgi:hypothetical protein
MSSDPSAIPVDSSSRGSTDRSGLDSSSSSSNRSTQTGDSNERMVPTKVWAKQEYVDLMPPYSKSDFERLKKSIKEHGGLLVPIVINQDSVVLDGHHRMRACKELGLKVSYNTKDFTNQPLAELRYVVAVNLHRRDLNQFQRAEMGLKMYNTSGTMAKQRQQASRFTTETGKAAAAKRFDGGDIACEKPLRSLDAEDSDDEGEEKDLAPLRSSQEIGDEVGVSRTTIDRVKAILKDGTSDEINSLRQNKGPGIKTVYKKIRNHKLRKRFEEQQQYAMPQPVASRSDNPKLFNKDFRAVTQVEIPDGSIDLVLALNFPEVSIREDEEGRIHERLMESASRWLKEGGLLVMHVEQRFLPRVTTSPHFMLQFYHVLCVTDPGFSKQQLSYSIFRTAWRPYCVYVKGLRDTQPQISVSGPVSDVITIPDGSEYDEKDLANDLIRLLSPEGAFVCDPFMGKGEVGRAALEAGRTDRGIEKEATLFLSTMNALHEQ